MRKKIVSFILDSFLKLTFVVSLLSNLSTICTHMLSKFANQFIQKSLIFSNKAIFTRSLFSFCLFNHLIFNALNSQESVCCTENLDDRVLYWPAAVQKAIGFSPKLKMVEADIQSASARVNEVGLLPNPQLNIGWGQDSCIGNDIDNGEFSVTINQLIETGGKRGKRVDLALYEYRAAYSNYEIVKLGVIKELAFAYIDAVASQEKLKLAIEQKKLANEFLLSIQAQLETGKVSLIEHHKALIGYSAVEILEEKANLAFINSKENLSLLLGFPCDSFDEIQYPFYQLFPPSALCGYLKQLSTHPILLKEQIYYEAALAGVSLERSNSIPDFILQVGVSRDCGERDTGLTLGVSFPLPIFNRNQWGVAKANSQVSKMESEWEQINLNLQRLLRKAYSDFLMTYKILEKMQTFILPATEKSLVFMQTCYKEGKVDYFEVLKAYELTFDARLKYIDALADYHKMKATIDYLDGN